VINYNKISFLPYQTGLVTKLMRISEVKKALRANESIVFADCTDKVGIALSEDVMQSV
jgi:vitellogenic carboxypeptidase-like protein